MAVIDEQIVTLASLKRSLPNVEKKTSPSVVNKRRYLNYSLREEPGGLEAALESSIALRCTRSNRRWEKPSFLLQRGSRLILEGTRMQKIPGNHKQK